MRDECEFQRRQNYHNIVVELDPHLFVYIFRQNLLVNTLFGEVHQ